MQPTSNKFLLLLAALTLHSTLAWAQLPQFFRKAESRPAQVPLRQYDQPRPTVQQYQQVIQQVQLEEAISGPVVPPAVDEADLPGLGGATTDLDMPPVPEAPSSAVDAIELDPGFGQDYDIPLSDVMPQVAETYSTNDWFRNGDWYSKQEFVMLLRADLPAQHLAIDQTVGVFRDTGFFPLSDPNITHSLSTKHVDFTYEPGTRITIGHRLGRDPGNRDHSLEFSFHGLFEYSNALTMRRIRPVLNTGIFSLLGSEESVFSQLTGAVGFATQNPVSGLVANDTVNVLSSSDFNSFEVNYVIGARPAKDRLVMQPDGRWVRHATPSKVRGLFAGLRYIRQNDFFRYQGVGEVQSDGTIASDVGADYEVQTGNDMVGIHIGGEFARKRTDWMLGFRGKVGGLINFSDRTNRLTQFLPSTATGERVIATIITEDSGSDETLAFLSECGAYVAYYIRPNTALRMGYDVLYMNGLATATNNLGIRGQGFAKFETTGDSLYHGMNFGFEMTW